MDELEFIDIYRARDRSVGNKDDSMMINGFGGTVKKQEQQQSGLFVDVMDMVQE